MAFARTMDEQKRRLRELVRRRRRAATKPVLDPRLTEDDIRRADELIEKYGLWFLVEDP